MLIPNHPHDERLAALAAHDTDAVADATLTAHVASCVRCTGLVDELGALRAALADLPDIAPARPLRLLPPAEAAPASTADRLGGWARRFFAPVLASGAALALVGTIGTAAPALNQAASGPSGDSAARQSAAQELAAPAPESEAPAGEAAGGAPAFASPGDGADRASNDAAAPVATPAAEEPEGPSVLSVEDDGDAAETRDSIPAERSPWPMVLFAGVALMIGALALRWILVPRAG
jgi:hypothetical protein